jgi:hypothetical protein
MKVRMRVRVHARAKLRNEKKVKVVRWAKVVVVKV